MAGFRNSSDDSSPLAEINVTPLVDVMLVLLVIFMVTAPFMESGIPLQLPKTSAKNLPKQEDTPVSLHLTKDNKLFLGKEEVVPNELRARLLSFFKGREKKEIFIRADGALAYAFVAQTIARVKSAGIDKIGLVTLPEDEKN